MRFREKPCIVEAWQVDPNATGRPDWVDAGFREGRFYWDVLVNGAFVFLRLVNDETAFAERGKPGEWLVLNHGGRLSFCDDETFRFTYEPMDVRCTDPAPVAFGGPLPAKE